MGLFVVATTALSACNTCERLETKICAELGAEDCAVWRKSGQSEAILGQRMNTCGSSLFGSSYDAQLTGARFTVDAMKKAKAPRAKKD